MLKTFCFSFYLCSITSCNNTMRRQFFMSSPARSGMRTSLSSVMMNLGRGRNMGGSCCGFILITSLMFYCFFELSRFLLLMCLKDLFVIIMTFVNYASSALFSSFWHCFSFFKDSYFLLLTTSVLLLICSKLPFASGFLFSFLQDSVYLS